MSDRGAADSVDHLKQIREAKERFGDALLSIPEVNAIGIGYRRAGGRITSELALVVCVDRKIPWDAVRPSHRVPAELAFTSGTDDRRLTVPTDVQEMSRIIRNDHVSLSTLSAESRPAPGGVGIGTTGASGGGSGTLGGWVFDALNKRIVLLCNRHVLGSGPDHVFQPHLGEGGDPNEPFATWTRASSSWDAAIATPVKPSYVKSEIVGLGKAVWSVTSPHLDMPVEKTGRSTGHTTGTIDLLDVDTTKDGGSKWDFRIAPTPPSTKFSFPMDSGSIVLEQGPPPGSSWKRAVGLLWGSTSDYQFTVAQPIKSVFADLQLTTLVGWVAWILSKYWPWIAAKLAGASVTSAQRASVFPMPSAAARQLAVVIPDIVGTPFAVDAIERLLSDDLDPLAPASETERAALFEALQSFMRREGDI